LAGLEGDTLELNDGYLLRNGQMVDIPEKLMFNYYVKKRMIHNQDILKKLSIQPIFRKDAVIFTLTSMEFKKLSRFILLHSYVRPENQSLKVILDKLKVKSLSTPDNKLLVIPKGYGFVFGDNRGTSFQSPCFGLVLIKDIAATVIF
jgi:hypothetical protein